MTLIVQSEQREIAFVRSTLGDAYRHLALRHSMVVPDFDYARKRATAHLLLPNLENIDREDTDREDRRCEQGIASE